jgi:hypothetical protein
MVLVLSITTVSLLAGVVYLTINKSKLEDKLQDEKIKLLATTKYAESLALKLDGVQKALDRCQPTSIDRLYPKNKTPKQA